MFTWNICQIISKQFHKNQYLCVNNSDRNRKKGQNALNILFSRTTCPGLIQNDDSRHSVLMRVGGDLCSLLIHLNLNKSKLDGFWLWLWSSYSSNPLPWCTLTFTYSLVKYVTLELVSRDFKDLCHDSKGSVMKWTAVMKGSERADSNPHRIFISVNINLPLTQTEIS